jgi:hypothetical protein
MLYICIYIYRASNLIFYTSTFHFSIKIWVSACRYTNSFYFQVQLLLAETTTISEWKQQNDVSLLCVIYPNVKPYVLFQHKYIAVRMS